MPDLKEHALAYAGAGLAVFPCKPDKAPHTEHGLKDASVDPAIIETWWQTWPDALIAGRLPENQMALDIDPRHGGLDTWVALKNEYGPLPETRAHYSGRKDGGGHVWWLRPPGKLTTKPLDQWARQHGTGHETEHGWTCGLDILHHNLRYSILPPSLHASTGLPYEWAYLHGLEIQPAEMPPWLADLLIDRTPAPEPFERRSLPTSDGSIADWYCDQASWRDILTGWQLLSGDGESDGSKWRHPAATAPFSATVRHGCLFVYSPNTPFEETGADDPHGYTKFRANAILNHHGNLSAAAKWLGEQRDGPPVDLIGPIVKEQAQTLHSQPATQGNAQTDQPGRRIKLTPASSITPRPVRWLWQDRIPQGALTLLGGREGIGKSTYAYDLAADITRGKVPGEHKGTPKPVLVAATEDSWSHTIVPRLIAAGANLDIVYRIDVTTDEIDTILLTLPRDVDELAKAASQSQAGLILLDPLLSRLDVKLDTHKDAEVRVALEPITRLADQTNIGVMGLIHVNKSSSGDPLTMLMGSRAFAAVARAVLFIMVDPENPGIRLLGQAKNNLGRLDLPTLTFTIENTLATKTVEGDIWTGKLCWGEDSHMSITDAIDAAGRSSDERSQTVEATDWLKDYMHSRGGAEDSATIKQQSTKAGYKDWVLRQAREKLHLEIEHVGFPRKTYWKLPNATISSGVQSGGEFSQQPTGQNGHIDASGAVVRLSETPRTTRTTVTVADLI